MGVSATKPTEIWSGPEGEHLEIDDGFDLFDNYKKRKGKILFLFNFKRIKFTHKFMNNYS